MGVYVDNAELPYGRMKMCHLIADTHEELVRMADAIGVARRWIQGGTREHFDICLAKRKLAVAQGAIEVDQRQLLSILKGGSHAQGQGTGNTAGGSAASL